MSRTRSSTDAPTTVVPSSAEALPRRLLGEFIGTGILVAAIVGSGIAAERLAPGEVGMQLFVNAAATGAAIAVAISILTPAFGAHLNPAVTLSERIDRRIAGRDAAAYLCAQVLGAAGGAIVANLMFSLPAVTISTTVRTGVGQWIGEVVASFGLVALVLALVRTGRGAMVAPAVGAWVFAAILFTSSTGFANPAVTIGRTLSDTFVGIAPASAPAFIAAQLVGAGLAVGAVRVLLPRSGR